MRSMRCCFKGKKEQGSFVLREMVKNFPARFKILFPLLMLSVFVIDRLFKSYALSHFSSNPVNLLGVIQLTYIQNTGISFGMFQNMNSVFIVISAVLVAVIIILRRKISEGSIYVYLALSLIVGGALGNLYDRIAHGYVIDFVDLAFFPAVFNAADFFITIGALLILIFSLFPKLRRGGRG